MKIIKRILKKKLQIYKMILKVCKMIRLLKSKNINKILLSNRLKFKI